LPAYAGTHLVDGTRIEKYYHDGTLERADGPAVVVT
jgi:hypothetical protein